MPDLDRIGIIQPGPLSIMGRGIRARLEEVFPPRQFSHVWMPGRLNAASWRKLTQRMPAVAIGFNGFEPKGAARGVGGSEWSVYLLTRNEAGDEKRLFGDDLAPGLFGLLEVGVAALHGHSIDDGGTVSVRTAAHMFVEDLQDDGIALAALELYVPTVINLTDVLAGGDAEPGTLQTQEIRWGFTSADVMSGSQAGEP